MILQNLWRRFVQAAPRRDLPGSMQQLRGGDPCWCGSGKKYRFCHRRSDRQELKKALKNTTVNPCNAFG